MVPFQWSFTLHSSRGYISDDDSETNDDSDQNVLHDEGTDGSKDLDTTEAPLGTVVEESESTQYKTNPWSIARINAAIRPTTSKNASLSSAQPEIRRIVHTIARPESEAKNQTQISIFHALQNQARKPPASSERTSPKLSTRRGSRGQPVSYVHASQNEPPATRNYLFEHSNSEAPPVNSRKSQLAPNDPSFAQTTFGATPIASQEEHPHEDYTLTNENPMHVFDLEVDRYLARLEAPTAPSPLRSPMLPHQTLLSHVHAPYTKILPNLPLRLRNVDVKSLVQELKQPPPSATAQHQVSAQSVSDHPFHNHSLPSSHQHVDSPSSSSQELFQPDIHQSISSPPSLYYKESAITATRLSKGLIPKFITGKKRKLETNLPRPSQHHPISLDNDEEWSTLPSKKSRKPAIVTDSVRTSGTFSMPLKWGSVLPGRGIVASERFGSHRKPPVYQPPAKMKIMGSNVQGDGSGSGGEKDRLSGDGAAEWKVSRIMRPEDLLRGNDQQGGLLGGRRK